MNISFCLPIISSSAAAVSSIVAQQQSEFHFLEIWLDYISDVEKLDFKNLTDSFPNRLIFLFRRKNLEPTLISAELTRLLLDQLTPLSCYIDIDVEAQLNLAKETASAIAASNSNAKLLLSYHHYSATPSTEKLSGILSSMEGLNPTIYKIATFCNSEEDALKLMQLALTLKNSGKKWIVLGMGVHGKITRVANAIWGGEMNFAPLDLSQASAPGQILKSDLEQMTSIFKDQ